MIKFFFCDDSPQFLKTLLPFVQKECLLQQSDPSDFEIGPAFSNGEALIEYVKNNSVDVLLLDIDMPDMSGFEVARIICREYKQIKIVFMSAYDHFVYNAFDFYPFAYLRKTHLSEEFPKLLRRISETMKESNPKIMLTTTNGEICVNSNEIAYVESRRNYIAVHMSNGEVSLCRRTLSDLEQELSNHDFYRIHSGFLVNLEQVDRFIDKKEVVVAGTPLPIAQHRTMDFKKTYMSYIRRSLGT